MKGHLLTINDHQLLKIVHSESLLVVHTELVFDESRDQASLADLTVADHDDFHHEV